MENSNNYILGNTIELPLDELKDRHIIPTHAKDNSALISQFDFISTTESILRSKYEVISKPFINISHKVRGRIPEARFKKKEELLPHEETIYYNRLIFLYRLEQVTKVINDNSLKLVVGGVKCYSHDNLNGNYKSIQKFKAFIGFQVKVCNNLCIWADGSIAEIKCNTLDALLYHLTEIIRKYDAESQLSSIDKLDKYSLSEKQIAQVLGRLKMYNFMPYQQKQSLLSLDINETQVSAMIKNYYVDDVFGVKDRDLNLWELYNLFTEASKSSYIDKFTSRNISSSVLINDLIGHLEGEKESFFLS